MITAGQFDPSAPMRTVPPPDAVSGRTRAQIELQRTRAALTGLEKRENGEDDDALLNSLRVRRELYDRNWSDNVNGFVPDPARNVASHWKILRSDRRGGVTFKEDGKLANPAEFAADYGPFKVRWLRGAKCGAVENLDPEQYMWARAGYFRGFPVVSCEPVPDSEVLCPPTRPPNMPSSFKKAQAITGKHLKKPAEEVTYAEAAAHFKNLMTGKPG